MNVRLCAVFLGLVSAGCGGEGTESMTHRSESGIEAAEWGEAEGQPVSLYTLTGAGGVVVKITNYGGIITELHAPDRSGQMADIVLGFDNLGRYTERHPFFGAIVGRVANRIGGAKFILDGTEYSLAANNGPNHLHGGQKGFDKRVWEASADQGPDGPRLVLKYLSPHAEEGYPGNLQATVTYTLTADNDLKMMMEALTDHPTPVNLTNHSYFNLKGHDRGDVLDHQVTLHAERYTPVDSGLIPTGLVEPVAGTPYDFREAKTIGRDIASIPSDPATGSPGGYDINFAVDGEAGSLRPAARVVEPGSGRVLEILATQPGVQFYTGNFLKSVAGKDGAVYDKHAGFCLETQNYPDAVNRPEFPSAILRPGETYRHEVVYRFRTQ